MQWLKFFAYILMNCKLLEMVLACEFMHVALIFHTAHLESSDYQLFRMPGVDSWSHLFSVWNSAEKVVGPHALNLKS